MANDKCCAPEFVRLLSRSGIKHCGDHFTENRRVPAMDEPHYEFCGAR